MTSLEGKAFATKMGIIIKKGFDSKESLPAKEMTSTERNCFHWKKWLPQNDHLPLKRMASTKRNGFHLKQWLTLNVMAPTKSNGFL